MKVTLGGALGNDLTKANKKVEKKGSERLARFLKMYRNSYDYAKNHYFERWERNWKLYHNIRTNPAHEGIVKAFVPMVNSTVNTIVAALFNSNPAVDFLPNYQDQTQDTKVLSELYSDFALIDGWLQKNKANGRQGIIIGNMFTFYEWKQNKNGGYVHKTNIPARDMIIDPCSHGPEDWRYVGRVIYVSKEALENELIYDFEKSKMVKRYSNLEKIGNGSVTLGEYNSDKERKDQIIGSTTPKDKDQIELVEIWTRKRVVVIANGSTIIEDRENPHYALEKSLYEQRKLDFEQARLQGEVEGEFDEEFDEENAGLLPFAHGRMYPDISLPYSDSDVDIIADQQELLNELTELNIEAALYTVYPEKTVDPKFASQSGDLDPLPGRVYFMPQNAMSWNAPPQIPNNIFNERVNVKDEIREAIAVSQISKGVSASDATTATEIKATLGRGDSRIQEKAQTLANDFFKQEASIVLKLIQLYAPDKMWVRSTQDAHVSFTEVNPREFLGEYTPMVTMDIQRKLQEAESREAYLQAYQMLISDPSNNLAKIKEHCLPKILVDMTPEQIAEMTTTPQLPANGADLGAMVGEVLQPGIDEGGTVTTPNTANNGGLYE